MVRLSRRHTTAGQPPCGRRLSGGLTKRSRGVQFGGREAEGPGGRYRNSNEHTDLTRGAGAGLLCRRWRRVSRDGFGAGMLLGGAIVTGQEGPRVFEATVDVGRGIESEVANLVEARGQDVEEEATDELVEDR